MVIRWLSALIRGGHANFPCPRCYVPKDQQSNILQRWPLRTQEESKRTYQAALELIGDRKPGRAEELLKANGLYLVQVRELAIVVKHDLHCLLIECMVVNLPSGYPSSPFVRSPPYIVAWAVGKPSMADSIGNNIARKSVHFGSAVCIVLHRTSISQPADAIQQSPKRPIFSRIDSVE